MLLRRFTDFVLRSRVHAMGVAFVLSLIPLFGASLGILVAAFVTLLRGAFEGTLVLCATVAPFILSYALSFDATQSQMMMVATATIVAINVLTWLLALVLRCYSSWSRVVGVSVLVGILLVCIIHLMFPGVQDWSGAQLTAYMNKTATMLQQLAPTDVSARQDVQAASMIAAMKPYITGFVVASILLNALVQLVITRWWQAIIFNPGELRKELYRIRLDYLLAGVFIAVLALAYVNNAYAMDMLPVMVVGFAAAGLSLVHAILKASRAGFFWLILVYLAVIFIFPAGIVLVAMAGLLDSFFDIRLRFAR